MKFWSVCDFLLSWVLAVVFLSAAIPHWDNSYYFLGSVYAYQLTDARIGQIITATLPLIQLGLSFCLLTRLFFGAAHLGTLFLLAVFVAVQTSAYVRGLDISCGCFGPGDDSSIGWFSLSLVYSLFMISVARNFALFLSAPRMPK